MNIVEVVTIDHANDEYPFTFITTSALLKGALLILIYIQLLP